MQILIQKPTIMFYNAVYLLKNVISNAHEELGWQKLKHSCQLKNYATTTTDVLRTS